MYKANENARFTQHLCSDSQKGTHFPFGGFLNFDLILSYYHKELCRGLVILLAFAEIMVFLFVCLEICQVRCHNSTAPVGFKSTKDANYVNFSAIF